MRPRYSKNIFVKLGKLVSFEELVNVDRAGNDDKYRNLNSDGLWQILPTISDIHHRYLRMKNNKAGGECNVTTNVHKTFALSMAKAVWPLHVKATIRLSPPLQWKGGMVAALFKGKGSSAICENYRDILLADDNGKDFSAHLRHHMLPIVRHMAWGTQFGSGLNGGETCMAHLYIRTAFELCSHANVSAAVLFLDVVAAFASMLRRLVFDEDHGDEVWLRQLRACGLSDTDIEAIYAHIKHFAFGTDGEGVVYSGCDNGIKLAFELVNQSYTNTWMSNEGIPSVIATSQGCAAGTPMADLIYCVAMSRVLITLYSSLKNDGLLSEVKCGGTSVQLHDVSYPDDTALTIAAPASEIVNKTAKVAAVCVDVFKTFFFTLNWKTNKSEAIISFKGPGARKAKKHLIFNLLNQVTLTTLVGQIVLRFVESYVHLGSKTTACASNVGLEVAHRAAIINREARKLYVDVLANKQITFVKKSQICQAFILSKGTHHISTWPAVPLVQFKKFHHAVMLMYRRATNQVAHSNRDPFLALSSDNDILLEFGLISPANLVRRARVLLFSRIITKNVISLLSSAVLLSKVKSTWAYAVMDDLRILSCLPEFSSCIGYDMRQWINFIQGDGKGFYGKVGKFFAKSKFANNLVDKFDPANIVNTPYQCPTCGVWKKSFQAFSVHNLTHGGKNPMRRYVGSETHCVWCMKTFWTRERLVNGHLRRSKVCRAMHLLHDPIYS